MTEMTDQRRSERLTDPTHTAGTPEARSAVYGHARAVKQPSSTSRDTRSRLSPEDRNAARRWITRRYTGSDRDQLLAMLGLDDTQEEPR